MSELTSGECSISDQEIQNLPLELSGFTPSMFPMILASRLRERGAPIVGVFLPKFDERYEVTSCMDYKAAKCIYKWRPIANKAH